jgi:hypothetical protein
VPTLCLGDNNWNFLELYGVDFTLSNVFDFASGSYG